MPATLDRGIRKGVGASESPALFGLHPFLTPLGLYSRLIGMAPAEETLVQRRGTRLEGYLAAEYADREHLFCAQPPVADQGAFLYDPGTQRHPVHPRLIASPDRVIVRDGQPTALVEIKTARSRRGWSDPTETPDGAPLHYLMQVQHQLLVGVEYAGRHWWPDRAVIVASVGSLDDFRCYEIASNAAVQAQVLLRVMDFWTSHVEPRNPPPWDGSEAGHALLKALYPTGGRPELRPATELVQATMAELKHARAIHKAAETERGRLEQVLKDAIGKGGTGFESDDFRVTWNQNKPSRKTDYAAALDEYITNHPEQSAPLARCIEAHTEDKPGAIVLRPTWRDDE